MTRPSPALEHARRERDRFATRARHLSGEITRAMKDGQRALAESLRAPFHRAVAQAQRWGRIARGGPP